jgi:hypothetical protein
MPTCIAKLPQQAFDCNNQDQSTHLADLKISEGVYA